MKLKSSFMAIVKALSLFSDAAKESSASLRDFGESYRFAKREYDARHQARMFTRTTVSPIDASSNDIVDWQYSDGSRWRQIR